MEAISQLSMVSYQRMGIQPTRFTFCPLVALRLWKSRWQWLFLLQTELPAALVISGNCVGGLGIREDRIWLQLVICQNLWVCRF